MLTTLSLRLLADNTNCAPLHPATADDGASFWHAYCFPPGARHCSVFAALRREDGGLLVPPIALAKHQSVTVTLEKGRCGEDYTRTGSGEEVEPLPASVVMAACGLESANAIAAAVWQVLGPMAGPLRRVVAMVDICVTVARTHKVDPHASEAVRWHNGSKEPSRPQHATGRGTREKTKASGGATKQEEEDGEEGPTLYDMLLRPEVFFVAPFTNLPSSQRTVPPAQRIPCTAETLARMGLGHLRLSRAVTCAHAETASSSLSPHRGGHAGSTRNPIATHTRLMAA